MQYNSETNDQDIYSQGLWWCDATTTDYGINDFTRNVNPAYHRFITKIQGWSSDWQYDDTNNTTLPIGTTDLVSGQQDYSLDDAMLEIERLETKDSNGNWTKLKPLDKKDMTDIAVDEYMKTDGIPVQFDKVGRSLFLYPAPNFSQVASLKIHFRRSANIFSVSDTTEEPGFSDSFHEILALEGALPYAMKYKPERVQMILTKLKEYDALAEDFYTRRDKEDVMELEMSEVDYI